MPTCKCIDFRIKKLPCKHICAAVQQPGVGWESLGSRYGTHPLFSLDNEVIQSSLQSDKCKPPSEPSNSTRSPPVNFTSVEEGKSKPLTSPLPSRKKVNHRKQCIQKMNTLHDELYVITDKNVLNETLKKIREVLSYTRKHCPKETESR